FAVLHLLPPPRPTLFPYTTLFRSVLLTRRRSRARGTGDGPAPTRAVAPSPVRRRCGAGAAIFLRAPSRGRRTCGTAGRRFLQPGSAACHRLGMTSLSPPFPFFAYILSQNYAVS